MIEEVKRNLKHVTCISGYVLLQPFECTQTLAHTLAAACPLLVRGLPSYIALLCLFMLKPFLVGFRAG